MASYYSPGELTEIGAGIVRVAGSVDDEMPPLERAALMQLLNVSALGERRGELLKLIPAGLSEALGLAVPPAGELKTGVARCEARPSPRGPASRG